MATTPPPPRRIRTPPTPLHGRQYDDWEPYSPRRSTRVAAQKKQSTLKDHFASASKPAPRAARAVTPTGPRNGASLAEASSPTLSPVSPSSPVRPSKRPVYENPFVKKRSAHTSSRAVNTTTEESGSEIEQPQPKRTLQHLFDNEPNFLPTPTKTPRKRPAPSQSSLSSTARVLFPGRPATIDDAMPDPRKSRSAKKLSHFTLQSFADDLDNSPGENSKIQIYTDSKERVPEVGDEEDNPFITKKAAGKAKAKPVAKDASRKRKSRTEEQKQMEEAVHNDEGVLYVFRGRKVFRRFTETRPVAESDDDSILGSDAEVIDQDVRRSSRHRMTRTTIKPRLLFPTEEQARRRAAAAAKSTEEETEKQVEDKKPTAPATPAKRHVRQLTPPETVSRSTRSHDRKKTPEAAESAEPETPSHHHPKPSSTLPASAHLTRGKKNSPFDSWRRTKSSAPAASVSAHKGTKRGADALGSPAAQPHAGKRTRSGAHAGGAGEL